MNEDSSFPRLDPSLPRGFARIPQAYYHLANRHSLRSTTRALCDKIFEFTLAINQVDVQLSTRQLRDLTGQSTSTINNGLKEAQAAGIFTTRYPSPIGDRLRTNHFVILLPLDQQLDTLRKIRFPLLYQQGDSKFETSESNGSTRMIRNANHDSINNININTPADAGLEASPEEAKREPGKSEINPLLANKDRILATYQGGISGQTHSQREAAERAARLDWQRGRFGHIRLSDNEFKELSERIGADLLKMRVDSLDAYIDRDPTARNRQRGFLAHRDLLTWKAYPHEGRGARMTTVTVPKPRPPAAAPRPLTSMDAAAVQRERDRRQAIIDSQDRVKHEENRRVLRESVEKIASQDSKVSTARATSSTTISAYCCTSGMSGNPGLPLSSAGSNLPRYGSSRANTSSDATPRMM